MRVGGGPLQNLDWLYEIRNGRAFTFGALLAASVGNLDEVQLFNPAASGKTIIVHMTYCALETLGVVQLRTHNVALATLVGTGKNLQNGAAAGVGEIRTAQPAAADGTLIGRREMLAADFHPLHTEWYIALDAGEGYLINSGSPNVVMTTDMEWIEF